jgi:hypothetical protein
LRDLIVVLLQAAMKHQSVFILIFFSKKMGKQLNKGDKKYFYFNLFPSKLCLSPSTHQGSEENGEKSLLRKKFTQKIVINSSINALRSYFSHCV